jgi:lauroyl/myristoyl acyltransferase
MTLALGSPPPASAVSGYFDRLADLITYGTLIARKDLASSGLRDRWEVEPGSVEIMNAARAPAKGAILAVPHLTGSEIAGGAVADLIPVTMLARRSPDPVYQAAKERWYTSLGVNVSWRPRKDSEFSGMQEMTGALRVLRKNRVLAITPDLVRAPGTGVPVRLFGRPVEIPAGPFFLAVRTEAPLVPAFFYHADGAFRMRVMEPLPVREGTRDEAIALMAQEWTDLFEAWVREYPEMWQFWLDKRWVRWLQETPVQQSEDGERVCG